MAAIKLYAALAEWWPLLSPVDEYADEAAFFLDVLSRHYANHPSDQRRTLVEFGSGGGSNAFYLKAQFDMTLVDRSPEMLAVSHILNPECEHLVGDMRSVRLGRCFDGVFIHDAIDYMTTEADLRRAIETAYTHCAPGGVALFIPDYVRETFAPTTEHGGRDGEDRALRYLEWQYDPNPADTIYTVHFALLLREGDTVRTEHDQHENGLFARADWLRLLHTVGFAPQRLSDAYGRDIFVAMKSR
ncbi:MAG: class I SAM-dependent methyltransferase [Ktedonobacterales bacterium]